MSAYQSTDPVEAKLMQVAELFGSVCADPDDPEVTYQADAALWELDELLTNAS
jgi:hypothetical protein